MVDLKEIKNSTFLVTGGAGFIGSHIVEFLIAHQAKRVVVLDNLSTGFLENLSAYLNFSNFEFIQGDITCYEDCLKACKGIDFVSHQAALGSVPRSIENPIATHEANATGFINMLMACKDQKVQRVVYASSSSVYGDISDSPKTESRIGKPLSPYAVSKLVNEQYAAIFSSVYQMKIVGLRYFNVFGPRQNPKGDYAAAIPLFIDSVLNDKDVFINGNGEQSRDFTFVSNAVQGNILALLKPFSNTMNDVFNIAFGSSVTVNELYFEIAGLLSCSKKPIYRSERFGDVLHSKADITKAKQVLSFEPLVNFHEGLSETVNWFKNSH